MIKSYTLRLGSKVPKYYTLKDNQIIIHPGTCRERNLTEEEIECRYCKHAPKNKCDHRNPVSYPACDWFTIKASYTEV